MPVAGDNEDTKTFTQEDVDRIIAEQTAGLKANRDELIKEAKRAKDTLKGYEGVDPDEFKKLKQQAEEADRKKAEAQGDFKSLEKQLIDRHQAELDTRKARETKLERALNNRLTSDELRKALVGKADPTMMELLVEHGSKYVRIRETDDDFEQYVADEKGNPLVADGKGTPMTVEMFVDQTLKAKFPTAFLGTGSSGGGASKSQGGALGGAKHIPSTNDPAFIANLAEVASGKVTVG